MSSTEGHRLGVSNKIVWNVLHDVFPEKLNVYNISMRAEKDYGRKLSSDAVRNALERMAPYGCVRRHDRVYDPTIDKLALQWSATNIRPPEPGAKKAQMPAVPVSANEVDYREYIEKLLTELEWGLASQRKKHAIPPPAEAWLERSEHLIRKTRKFLVTTAPQTTQP